MLVLRTAVRKVERLAYSPDGTRLAINGDGWTQVFDIATGRDLRAIDGTGMAAMAFSADGESLTLGALYRPVTAVHVSTGDCRTANDDASLGQVRLLPGGEAWISVGLYEVSRWRLGADGRQLNRNCSHTWGHVLHTEGLPRPCVTSLGRPLRVALIAATDRIAHHLYLLDGDTGELLSLHRCGYSSVEHFTGSPCGSYLVGVLQATLIVWDTAALHLPPQRWANDSRKLFTGVAFHPHGRHLLTASNDKSVKLWDLTCGQVVRSYDWSAGRMRSVAVAPDGLTAAAGSDENLVVVFDLDL